MRIAHPMAAVLVLALAGCAGVATTGAGAPEPDHAAALAAVDWSQATPLSLELFNSGYRPRELVLKVGQPYKLSLTNFGSMNHYFTAPEFFRTMATRKVVVERLAEIKAPTFTAFEVFARGGRVDIYLVPLVQGRYVAYCSMEGHRDNGVEGMITVE